MIDGSIRRLARWAMPWLIRRFVRPSIDSRIDSMGDSSTGPLIRSPTHRMILRMVRRVANFFTDLSMD